MTITRYMMEHRLSETRQDNARISGALQGINQALHHYADKPERYSGDSRERTNGSVLIELEAIKTLSGRINREVTRFIKTAREEGIDLTPHPDMGITPEDDT